MRSVVFVGNSHVIPLRWAAEMKLNADGELTPSCSFVMVDVSGNNVRIWGSDPEWRSQEITRWNPAEEQCRPLAALIAEADCVAVLWAGNQMTQRALIASEVPYDVVYDGSHIPTADRILVPVSAVASITRERMTADGRVEQLLSMCRSARIPNVIFLGPPPPLPTPAIKERLPKDEWFLSRVEQLSLDIENLPIEEDMLRVRLWNIMIDEYRRFAVDNGCLFLPPPLETQESDGTLAALYWHVDTAHANAAYGAVYLRTFLDWVHTKEEDAPRPLTS